MYEMTNEDRAIMIEAVRDAAATTIVEIMDNPLSEMYPLCGKVLLQALQFVAEEGIELAGLDLSELAVDGKVEDMSEKMKRRERLRDQVVQLRGRIEEGGGYDPEDQS